MESTECRESDASDVASTATLAPKQEKMFARKRWSSVFTKGRAVHDSSFSEDYKIDPTHTGSLVERFLMADETSSVASMNSKTGGSRASERTLTANELLAFLNRDCQSMELSGPNSTEVSQEITRSCRCVKHRRIDIARDYDARRLIYLHSFGDAEDTSLELHLLHFTKPTKSIFSILSQLRLGLDEEQGDGMENDREKLESEQMPLAVTWVDAFCIDQVSNREKSKSITVMGNTYSKWTAWALAQPEDDALEYLELGAVETEARDKVLMMDYDLEAEQSNKLCRPMIECKFSGPDRGGTLQQHLDCVQNIFGSLRTHIHRNRHLKLAYTILLTGAQLACIVPIQGYDIEHGGLRTLHQALTTEDPKLRLLHHLRLDFGTLTHPTTVLYVSSALAYGAVAMHQYSINISDRLQQPFLIFGLLLGFWLSLPPLEALGTQRVVTSNLALTVTLALFVSAIAHWMLAICSTQKECEGLGVVNESMVDGDVV